MKNVYGYVRVSSLSQSYDSQVDTIKEYCKIRDLKLVNIFADKVSGKSTDRAQYQALLAALEKNVAGVDAVVVVKIDRVGRNLKDLLIFVDLLAELKVEFVSLHDNVDTSTAQGELFLHIMGMVSQYERTLIRERTTEGYKRYRVNGGKVGRTKIDIDMDEVRRQIASGIPKRRVARRMRIGIQTLYNRLKESPK